MAKKNLLHILKERFPEIKDEKLFAHIMCGEVICNGGRIRNPKEKINLDSDISIAGLKYVGRGGYKLESGLDQLDIDVKGLTIIDAGCSTGGFTDCLLQRGAKLVYAVDVGFNQLAWTLKNNSKVIDMEKTNIMSIETLDPIPNFAVADLSFRSVLGPASKLLDLISGDKILVLVKPQFEWEEPDIDFNGVVKDQGTIIDICTNLINKLEENRIYVQDLCFSGTKGRKGNQELFFLLTKDPNKKIKNPMEILTIKIRM